MNADANLVQHLLQMSRNIYYIKKILQINIADTLNADKYETHIVSERHF